MRPLTALAAACIAGAALPTPPALAAQATAASRQPAPADSSLARARRVLRTTPLIDGHNDLPWRIREDTVRPRDVGAYDLRRRAPGMTDIARLRRGMVSVQFCSVYIPGEREEPL